MKKRIVFLMIFFSFLFLGISLKAFFEQIVMGPFYTKKALSSRTFDFSGEDYSRGDILDCHGFSLTDTAIRPSIVFYPKLISNPEKICNKLQKEIPELSIRCSNIKPYYKNSNKIYPAPFSIEIPLGKEYIIDTINSWNEKGIVCLPVKTRYGPNSIAHHIVGYIGFQEGIYTKEGLLGIEKRWEEQLKSSPKNILSPILDAHHKPLHGLGYRNISLPSKDSLDVLLTIDSRYQRIVEKVLDEEKIIEGGVVLLDVKTGKILAAASRPVFNQRNPSGKNQIEKIIDYKVYPGSIFKIITAAAALEENIVSLNTKFNCVGSSNDFKVTCPRPHGKMSLTEAMKNSCNITFVNLGLKLGREKLQKYITEKFTFSLVEGKKIDSQEAFAHSIIGQVYIKTSPLEIANLMVTIARDGYHQPLENPWETRLIKGTKTEEGFKFINQKIKLEKIYGKSTAQQLKYLLEETNRSGSGKNAWLADYGSAGKTGTPNTDKKNEYIAWYAGYFPLQNPQIAMVIIVENKKGVSKNQLQGGRHAAPLFRKIAEEIIRTHD